ncbi:nuclear transport factor 2 family protein [Luteimonas aquatica]|uniref:nuclear transport factor 2 family protein n=1 Tax=Luteimonas aquatica TaxID=450364 RepID=UPI001F58E963|nr:nuclear transport factor 2 family protein [Luteimonas aquatica]
MTSPVFRICLALLALFAQPALPARAVEPSDSLQKTIAAQDAAFFAAFNRCDLEGWKRYLAEDVEFYQDNDAPTMTRDALVPSFVERCGKNGVAVLEREALPDTYEVHALQDYGAVQFGRHRFWVMEHGRRAQVAAEPRFVHLWRLRDGRWQITRVVSYGH